MKATGELRRYTRIRRHGARHLRERRALATFRRETFENAKGRCELCKRAPARDPHHLVPKARCADWKRRHDASINGFAVCRRCHDRLQTRPELAGVRYERALYAWKRETRS